MKVLIINSFYYPNLIGGAEQSVKNLAETLVKKGHEVFVLCTDVKDDVDIINGVNVFRIKTVNIINSIDYIKLKNNKFKKIIYRSLDLNGYMNSKKIKAILEKIDPDVVHINNFPGFGLNLFKLINSKKIPTLFTARDYYSICTNSKLIKSEGEVCTKENKLCNIYRKINKNAIKNVDYITAPSEFTIKLMNKFIGVKESKSECIFNSIDIDKSEILKTFNIKSLNLNKKECLDIVFLGRLDEYKGIKLLIDNIIDLRDNTINLHIAGDGPLQQEICEIAEIYENINYYGRLNNEGVSKLLMNCDLLAAPSLWNEPFGRIVLDAYKHCIPVITTGNGGLKEIVKHEKTGYVIDFFDKEVFKSTIYKYKDKDLLLDQMKNCKNEIEHYTNDIITQKYENLYKKIASRSQ